MSLRNELKEIAFENQLDFFGIGSVDRWAYAPVGRRPNDLLPEAKSVAVMGIKIPKAAIESNHRAYEDGLKHGIFSYMVFGYNKLNEVMDKTAMKVANHLEKKAGSKALLIPASAPRDEYLMMGMMSNRHSAVCAGLAEFGWNGLALTPEAGPRVRWVQVVTSCELEPDPLYNGPDFATETNAGSALMFALLRLSVKRKRTSWSSAVGHTGTRSSTAPVAGAA